MKRIERIVRWGVIIVGPLAIVAGGILLTRLLLGIPTIPGTDVPYLSLCLILSGACFIGFWIISKEPENSN